MNNNLISVLNVDTNELILMPVNELPNLGLDYTQYKTPIAKYKPTKKRKSTDAARNQIYRVYKQGALKRALEWGLSIGEFEKLTSQICYYCGAKPSNKHETKYQLFVYSGIDRLDNLKGYTPANCVPACGVCNRMKGTHNRDTFINHIQKILGRLK